MQNLSMILPIWTSTLKDDLINLLQNQLGAPDSIPNLLLQPQFFGEVEKIHWMGLVRVI